MLDAKKLAEIISYSFISHDEQAKTDKNRIRLWDKKTPYGVHPTWCAMTLLFETSLPEEIRVNGAQALLYHDLLEDTTASLPVDCPPAVKSLVLELTFANSKEAMKEIWNKSDTAKLLKLYDKVSNLLDSVWMTEEYLAPHKETVKKLTDFVEEKFGKLNIVIIARAMCVKNKP